MDAKIEQQKAALEKAKMKYEAEKEELAHLIKLRNEMRKFFSPPQEVGAVSSLSLHHRHQQVQPTEHLQRTE